jgi:hypothetical protein
MLAHSKMGIHATRSAMIRTVVAVVLIGPTGCAETMTHRDARPICEPQAPIEGKFDSRAPGFLIRLRPAADMVSVAHELAARYGFQLGIVDSVNTVITAGPMSPPAVAALRCDSAVEAIHHDAWMKVI